MHCVIGVDGGGSKTICVLVTLTGEIIARSESGGANYQSVGIDQAINSIYTAILQTIASLKSGLENIQIAAICLGLAGVSRQNDIDLVYKKFLESSQFSLLPTTITSEHLIIYHDALISLVGGIGHNIGIVVAVGTGSIVFGQNAQGETKRVGGWGYLLGDEGSAYQIAIAGLKAVMRSYDGRGASTALTEIFKNHFQLTNLEGLISVVYRSGWGVKEIASLAPIVDNVAVQGDLVANQIIDTVVAELTLATATVINSLFADQNQNQLEIVTTGSVWKGKSQIRQRFISQLQLQYSQIQIILPRNEPAYGAALLALKLI